MKQELDINNIERKPTVVLVSNQSEFDQLMQHLDGEGNKWRGGQRPTEWKPNNFNPPLGIMIDNSLLSWHPLNWINDSIHNIIPFPEYAAKHIKPKRDRKRVEKHKYDAVLFDLKMAQTALDNRNKEIDGWVKQNNELRAEIEKDRQLYREVLNERDKLKESVEHYADFSKQRLELIAELEAERDRLQAENAELKHKVAELNKAYSAANEALYYASENWNACAKSLQVLKREFEEEKIAAFELKATEHANLDTLARKLRDQRDTARFLAALFFLASAGFAVAVWIGKLLPVY